MGIASWLLDKAWDWMNPLSNIVSTKVKKAVKKLTPTVKGWLGFATKDKVEPRKGYPDLRDHFGKTAVYKDPTKREKKKTGIISEAWDIVQEVLPIAGAVGTAVSGAYLLERGLEYAGVREGAGLIGAKPSDLQPIGRGKLAPAPRKKRKGHVHKKHVMKKKHVRFRHKHKYGKKTHAHYIRHKKVKGHVKYRHVHKKKKRKKPKKGKRVTFTTKGGKRVSFIARR